MKTLAIALVAAGVLATTPVLACSPVPFRMYTPPVKPAELADHLVGRAAFVDVAVAESVELLDPAPVITANAFAGSVQVAPTPESIAEERQTQLDSGYGRVRFRVVERIKGDGPADFTLIANTRRSTGSIPRRRPVRRDDLEAASPPGGPCTTP